MNPVVHFELPYSDALRAMQFYKTVFAWDMKDLGEASGHYILATTATQDAKPGFPAGSINGGLYPFPNSSKLGCQTLYNTGLIFFKNHKRRMPKK